MGVWNDESVASPFLDIKDVEGWLRALGVGTGARLNGGVSLRTSFVDFFLSSELSKFFWPNALTLWIFLNPGTSNFLVGTPTFLESCSCFFLVSRFRNWFSNCNRMRLNSSILPDLCRRWFSNSWITRRYLLEDKPFLDSIPICFKRCSKAFSMVCLNRLKTFWSIFLAFAVPPIRISCFVVSLKSKYGAGFNYSSSTNEWNYWFSASSSKELLLMTLLSSEEDDSGDSFRTWTTLTSDIGLEGWSLIAMGPERMEASLPSTCVSHSVTTIK